MRWHAVAERFQVAVECLRLPTERRDIVVVPVEPLATGDDLEATEQQVEGVRERWSARLRMGVERPLHERESRDESEVAVLGAEPSLVLRCEVDIVDARVREMHPWDFVGHAREADVEKADGGRGLVSDRLDHLGDDCTDDCHHVEVVDDEGELGVERRVLRQVSRRVVRLCPKDRPGLEDTLVHTDHDLLVELWALREVRRATEVVDGEDVGAALGGGRDELRRRDLGEAETLERPAETAKSRCGDLERRPAGRMAKRNRRMVQNHRERLLETRATQVERQRRCRGCEDANRRKAELDAGRRL